MYKFCGKQDSTVVYGRSIIHEFCGKREFQMIYAKQVSSGIWFSGVDEFTLN